MRNLSILFLFLMSGCAGVIDVTKAKFATDISEKCYVANEPMTVYFADTYPDDTYQLISPKRKKLPLRSSLAPWEVGFIIEKGQLLKITKIYDRQYGTTGHCWEIFAQIEGEDSPEFLVPSCWIWHHHIWVTPDSPYRQSKNDSNLKINTDLITESKCI